MGPDALKQVLLNLVENAREAMDGADDPRGDIEVRILSEPQEKGHVGIEVLDRGPGLDDAVRSRVFDPFFTTKDEVHGVGLGLFVVEGLVRRHGGRVRASNRDGGGARFRVWLPASEEGASPRGEADQREGRG